MVSWYQGTGSKLLPIDVDSTPRILWIHSENKELCHLVARACLGTRFTTPKARHLPQEQLPILVEDVDSLKLWTLRRRMHWVATKLDDWRSCVFVITSQCPCWEILNRIGHTPRTRILQSPTAVADLDKTPLGCAPAVDGGLLVAYAALVRNETPDLVERVRRLVQLEL